VIVRYLLSDLGGGGGGIIPRIMGHRRQLGVS
jgi:hypothetical protein